MSYQDLVSSQRRRNGIDLDQQRRRERAEKPRPQRVVAVLVLAQDERLLERHLTNTANKRPPPRQHKTAPPNKPSSSFRVRRARREGGARGRTSSIALTRGSTTHTRISHRARERAITIDGETTNEGARSSRRAPPRGARAQILALRSPPQAPPLPGNVMCRAP